MEEHYTEPMSLAQLVSVALAVILIAVGGWMLASELYPAGAARPAPGPVPTLMPTPALSVPPPAPPAPTAPPPPPPPPVYVENHGGTVVINNSTTNVDVDICIALRCP